METHGWIYGAARLAGLCLAAPAFSSRLLSMHLRLAVAAAFALALGARDATWGGAEGAPALSWAAALPLAGEVLVGAALGWSACLVLAAARGAATLLSDQMGLAGAGAEGDGLGEPALRAFHGLLGLFIFLAADLHHECLRAAAESFSALPPGSLGAGGASAALARLIASSGARLFEAGVCLALPVTSVLLLTAAAQGILARVSPELDFFAFGFLLRAAVGLLVVLFTLPPVAGLCRGLLEAAIAEGRGVVLGVSG
ncbi:MAG: flagellar biosynthetic protein FliR [Planctomycetes bacterium]|nr:flagellar biosynthetic protein FliR [Planctomycetota bacterium]